MTGGGEVYYDLGNLNYSFITDAGNVEQLRSIPVVNALKKLGLQAETSGRNDILVGCPFCKEQVTVILRRFQLSELFGTITEEKILDTLFYSE